MTPSQKIQNRIRAFCKKYGILCYKLVGSLSGLPDLLLVKDSEVLFVEVKSKHDTLSPLQKHTIDALNKKQEIAIVIREGKNIEEILSGYLKMKKNAEKTLDNGAECGITNV